MNLMLNGEKSGSIKGFIVLIVFQSLGIIGFVMVKEDLRRSKYEAGDMTDGEKGVLNTNERVDAYYDPYQQTTTGLN